MKNIPVYVGLDYHQDSVQVCVLDGSGSVLRVSALLRDQRVRSPSASGTKGWRNWLEDNEGGQ